MHQNTGEVDALILMKFDKASNIAGQREYDIWCCSLTALVLIENMKHEQKWVKHVMVIAT
jgi:hypothetical protein